VGLNRDTQRDPTVAWDDSARWVGRSRRVCPGMYPLTEARDD